MSAIVLTRLPYRLHPTILAGIAGSEESWSSSISLTVTQFHRRHVHTSSATNEAGSSLLPRTLASSSIAEKDAAKSAASQPPLRPISTRVSPEAALPASDATNPGSNELNGEGGIRTLVRREPRNRFSRPAMSAGSAREVWGSESEGTEKGTAIQFSPLRCRAPGLAEAVRGQPFGSSSARVGGAERVCVVSA